MLYFFANFQIISILLLSIRGPYYTYNNKLARIGTALRSGCNCFNNRAATLLIIEDLPVIRMFKAECL